MSANGIADQIGHRDRGDFDERDIAVVGMACRFAGARDLSEYWQLTEDGRDGFGPIPQDRWDHGAFFDADPRAADKSYVHRGGFMDIRTFPAVALKVPPRRVEVMDPQQRLALELSYQAVDDLGRQPAELPYKTGVYVGMTAVEFRTLMTARVVAQLMASGALGQAPEDTEQLARAVEKLVAARPFMAPGILANMTAATVAQELKLHGPAFVTDSACASGLLAVSEAVSALRSRSVDMALAGGVYVCVTPEQHVGFSRVGAISPSGRCLPFDARADGFVQGDGGGMLALRRLEDAVEEGDRIYAVIRGIASNNDGGGEGPMAPVMEGQVEVVRAAWQDAGLSPERLGYLEAHGTGTGVGDKIELSGLLESVGREASEVVLGSAKANVGHTMSAAGIAGLIRVVQAVHHRRLPPMAGFESPKEDLPLEGSPFRLLTEARDWSNGNDLAGISSFGFGGTNVHAIVSPPPVAETRASVTAGTSAAAAPMRQQAELVLISAPDEPTLRDLAGRTADAVERDASATVAGVARAWGGRRRQAARLGVVAGDTAELAARLRAVAKGGFPDGVAIGTAGAAAPKLAFLFPGQGAQRTSMLAGIRDRFPVVEETLAEMDEAVRDLLELPLSHYLYPERREVPVDSERATAELTETEHCQPALFAVGMALVRLLETVGVRPDVVAGHSVGEFTAATAGGVLSPEQGCRFTAMRGLAMAGMRGDRGAMVALVCDRETAESLLVDGAVVANVNHPRQVVVSGSTEAVAEVAACAAAKGVKATTLKVSHGFHSQVFESLDLEPAIGRIEDFRAPEAVVASCIIDHPYRGAVEARSVFRAHATSPVLFTRALEQCKEQGAEVFLQVGAGGPLVSFARGTLGADAGAVISLASKDDDDGGTSLLLGLAELWVRGVEVDVTALAADLPVASVPPVVLPRREYWPVHATATNGRVRLNGASERVVEVPAGATGAATSPPAEVASGDDSMLDLVMDAVARISAYPKDGLRPGMSLAAELGFDSLMVADLSAELSKRLPELPGIPQELLVNDPTIADLVGFLEDPGEAAATAADDHLPLSRFSPVWHAAPLAGAGARPAEGPVLLVGAQGSELVSELAAGLGNAGYDVTFLPEGDAGDAPAAARICYVLPHKDPVPVSAVLAGEAEPVDHAGRLIALLDRQAQLGSLPELLLVRREDDPWAEAASGVVRSLAREDLGTRATSIHLSPSLLKGTGLRALTGFVGDELGSSERSVDVRYTREGRFCAGTKAVGESAEPYAPAAGDVVLVTGGTRGIGLKLGARLSELGAHVLLAGRSEPGSEARELLEGSDGAVEILRADVTNPESLRRALEGKPPVTLLVHAAGVLADGALGTVDPQAGRLAREVKGEGFLNAIRACGESLRVAMGVGSWAGRFGNRHQAHYAAGNALLSELTRHLPPRIRGVASELGPWTASDMVGTIPEAVRGTMRAEGVDFVADAPGLDALVEDLGSSSGPVVRGRRVPSVLRRNEHRDVLSAETHPFLEDHAVDGRPVLPLASAAAMMADAAGASAPLELSELTLFRGVPVTEPVPVSLRVDAETAQLRVGDDEELAYQATIRPLLERVDEPERLSGGEPGSISVGDFYARGTFHGPLLQGLVAVDGISESFGRGRVRAGDARAWVPGRPVSTWTVDPLVLDSAMQLCAYVAWTRMGRAGTPVSIGRYVQLHGVEPGTELVCEVRFGEQEEDRFRADIALYRDDGALVALAEDVVAQLRTIDREEPESDQGGADESFEPKAEWVDPAEWPEVKDLQLRIQMVEAMGLKNPYFDLHEGTARDTTRIEGREIVNYSSYNYLGLSGDPRVRGDVAAAMERYGTSVSASRLASGERPFHRELEAALADAVGSESCIVFPSGHATNVTVIGHLFGPSDLVLHDELIHDSCLQGIKLSGASRRGFRHDDPDHLQAQLKELRPNHEKVLILVEGAYSMDGDLAQLPRYLELKERFGCMLMVDEAHSFGTVGKTGRGLIEHFDLDPLRVDIVMGTLSKSMASMGGFIAASKVLVDYLRYTTPGFVFAAGMTPTIGQAALSALRLMADEPWRVQKLQKNSRLFYEAMKERGIDTGLARGLSPVVPAITGDSLTALKLAAELLEQGVNAKPIIFPAVADDAARLRFFVTALHTEEQLRDTADRVADTLARIRSKA